MKVTRKLVSLEISVCLSGLRSLRPIHETKNSEGHGLADGLESRNQSFCNRQGMRWSERSLSVQHVNLPQRIKRRSLGSRSGRHCLFQSQIAARDCIRHLRLL